jgi:hypothetical protein
MGFRALGILDTPAVLPSELQGSLYGADFVKGVPQGSYPIFSSLSFFVRPGSTFLRPDPRSRRAGARRSG